MIFRQLALFKKNALCSAIIVVSLLICSNSFAQKIELKGKVIDFDTKAPVAGATVSITLTNRATSTDDSGVFSLLLDLDTAYTLSFSSVQYRTYIQPIYLLDEKFITVELLKRSPSDLPEAIVIARKQDANISDARMSVININPAKLRRTPLVFGEADIIKAIALQTGITTIGEGAGGFSVRGGNADQNLVLIDGAPIFNTSHLLGFYSTVSPESVQDFTLYKGAIPASFGGRLSSLVSLNVRPGNPDTVHYGGVISPLSLHLFADGPVKKNKLTFFADGRIAFPKLIMNFIPGSVSNSYAFFYDGVAKLVYHFNTKNQVGISFYRSYDIFKFPGDTSYAWRSNIVSLNGRSEFNKKISFYYNANISYYSSDINGAQTNYQFRLRSSIENQELKAALHYQAFDKIYFEGGYNFVRFVVGPGELSPSQSKSQILFTQLNKEFGNETGAYLLGRFDITGNINLETGIRRNDFAYKGPNTIYQYAPGIPMSQETILNTIQYQKGKTIKNYGGWEPRILLKLGLDDKTSIKLSYIMMRQNLQLISNTISITPVDYWKLSDPLIKPATSNQTAVGIFRNFDDNEFETSIEGFYKSSDNLLDYKNGASLSMNPYIDASVLSAKGKSYGVELNVKKTKGTITGQIAYTWSRSLIRDISPFSSEQVNDGIFYPSNYDMPFDLNITGGIKLGQGWDFNCTFVYITGRPTTYPDGTYVINNTVVANYSARNEDRLPDYNRLDISFSHDSRRFAEQKKYTIINFSLYNVYARKNAYSIFYQRNGNVLNAYELSIFGTIIPSVTLSFYF
ncbi:MAG TPA: carboxypeptidase-like regulatory domain-containing protein [Puia sp.]|jgi:hypothetical protein|nr:carboxypeptidase-like regulatory domain-containing protein [Puia sp.]